MKTVSAAVCILLVAMGVGLAGGVADASALNLPSLSQPSLLRASKGAKHRHHHRRKKRRRTVRSRGAALNLHLGAVGISAPKGAIRKGQTLTIERGAPKQFPDLGAASLIGGPYTISTSQKQPNKPVKVTFSYQPGKLSAREQPLLLHGWDGIDSWVPEPTSVNKAAKTASARLAGFSPIDVAGDITWAAGDITGNRTDLPSGCGSAPSWIEWSATPYGRNDSLPACVGTDSDEGTLHIHIANNRGYAQYLTISNAALDLRRSNWSDSLEGLFANQIAAHAPGNSPTSFVLAPGSHADLAIDRPAESFGNTAVSLRAAPVGSSAFAEMGWALLSKVNKELGKRVDIANCVTSAVYNSLASNPTPSSAVDQLHSCAKAAASKLTGAAKSVLNKIASAVLVVDFFYKVVDLEAGDAYPPSIGFSIRGRNPTNPEIHLGNLSYGLLPAGQQTVEHLSASGGTAPYTFQISHAAANTASVPPWVQLAADGTLTVEPPAGTDRFVSFYVYATDATGQSSPFERERVEFSVGASTGGEWTALKAPLPADATSETAYLGAPTACSSTGTCIAVGSYETAAGPNQAMIETRQNGSWTAIPAPLPADAVAGSLNLESAACIDSGTCFVVGYYQTQGGDLQSFIATLANGSWTAAAAPLPSPAAFSKLSSVACGEASCVAVGFYEGPGEMLIETYANGAWTASVAPPPPAPTVNEAVLDQVACSPSDTCVAVGRYTETFGDPQKPLLLTRTNGSWSSSDAPAPSGAGAQPQGPACASAGNCFVTGLGEEAGGLRTALFETLSNGSWSASFSPLPADASGEFSGLEKAACSRGGTCAAIGGYRTGPSTNRGLLETFSAGSWKGEGAPLPADADSTAPLLRSVACSTATCVVAGRYSRPASFAEKNLIETLSSGAWTAISGPLPPDGDPFLTSELSSTACSATTCIAVGDYYDKNNSGAFYPLIETRADG